MSFDDSDVSEEFLHEEKRQASAWAKDLLSNPAGFCILDTETTGLDHLAEVVQIAVLRGDGRVLMDTLVKPRRSIPANATRIHGITNEMVAAAPHFGVAYNQLMKLLLDYPRCVIYSADYDIRLLMQSALGVNHTLEKLISEGVFECAMLQYARWYGDWNSYRGDFRWQKLQGGDHQALGDCRATLALLQKMAGVNHANRNSQEVTGLTD